MILQMLDQHLAVGRQTGEMLLVLREMVLIFTPRLAYPAPATRTEGGFEQYRRFILEQVRPAGLDDARQNQWLHGTRRQESGIAETGFLGNIAAAFDECDIKAGTCQKVSSCDSRQAAADNGNVFQCFILYHYYFVYLQALGNAA